MRNLCRLDPFRVTEPASLAFWGGYAGDGICGAFEIPSPVDWAPMHIIASSDLGWEHVSVSRKRRCPNWIEMSHVKSLFFQDGETVMQLHVAAADHINDHPYCLHLWRPLDQEIPLPPKWMVGGCTVEEAETEMRKLADASSRRSPGR